MLSARVRIDPWRRLWQPFGYEHILRADERVEVVARYILENPVRAGLARVVSEYPFVGSQVWDLKELISTLEASE